MENNILAPNEGKIAESRMGRRGAGSGQQSGLVVKDARHVLEKGEGGGSKCSS